MAALREIVLTCSNPNVARAAVASIGGEFAVRFAADASRLDLPSGVLAAKLVRAFARNAAADERQSVDTVTRGADQPILAGLHYILDRGLRAAASAKAALGETPPAWVIDACQEMRRGGIASRPRGFTPRLSRHEFFATVGR